MYPLGPGKEEVFMLGLSGSPWTKDEACRRAATCRKDALGRRAREREAASMVNEEGVVRLVAAKEEKGDADREQRAVSALLSALESSTGRRARCRRDRCGQTRGSDWKTVEVAAAARRVRRQIVQRGGSERPRRERSLSAVSYCLSFMASLFRQTQSSARQTLLQRRLVLSCHLCPFTPTPSPSTTTHRPHLTTAFLPLSRRTMSTSAASFSSAPFLTINSTRVPTGLYIDGQWVKGRGEPLDSVNPATEEVIGQFDTASREDVDLAVAAARTAFETTWGTNIAAGERGRLVNILADKLEQAVDKIAYVESLDSGKPLEWCKVSVLPYPSLFGRIRRSVWGGGCRGEPRGAVGLGK